MSQWINQFLENEIVNRTDKTDKPINEGLLSVLSVRLPGLFDEKRKKVENNPETGTDKTDKPIDEGPLSVLSVRPERLLERIFSPYCEQDFEERLAIAEYDGQQTTTQAERIAYLDAFVLVLITLPYEGAKDNWLDQRVNTAKDWLTDQGIPLPK